MAEIQLGDFLGSLHRPVQYSEDCVIATCEATEAKDSRYEFHRDINSTPTPKAR